MYRVCHQTWRCSIKRYGQQHACHVYSNLFTPPNNNGLVLKNDKFCGSNRHACWGCSPTLWIMIHLHRSSEVSTKVPVGLRWTFFPREALARSGTRRFNGCGEAVSTPAPAIWKVEAEARSKVLQTPCPAAKKKTASPFSIILLVDVSLVEDDQTHAE